MVKPYGPVHVISVLIASVSSEGYTPRMDVDKGLDENLDLKPCWVVQRGRLLVAFAHI